MATLNKVGDDVGLEMDRFRKDLGDRCLLDGLAEDHTFAVWTLGVFGTPTLVFQEQQAVFLKMAPPPSPGEAVVVFEDVRRLAENRHQIKEIKRPQV